jgi:hypothetical protein
MSDVTAGQAVPCFKVTGELIIEFKVTPERSANKRRFTTITSYTILVSNLQTEFQKKNFIKECCTLRPCGIV